MTDRPTSGRRQLSRNAAVSVIQTVASAGLMFVLYRAVLQSVGSEGLGVWSVVLASTGAVRIGELGLTGSAVKYAAGRLARGETDAASRVIETTVLTVAVVIGVLALGAYVILPRVLPAFIPEGGLPAAIALVPYACASFWLAAVGGALQSGLDGCGRIDLRNGVVLIAQVVYVGLGWALVHSDGLIGLAVAQIVQGGLLCLGAWALTRRVLPAAPPVPWRWDRPLFQEMLGYGLQYQVLGVVRMLYEPTTKALLGRYGGLDAAGLYEVATLVVTKIRALLIAAQQALTPEIASLQETRPSDIDAVLTSADRLNWFLSVPVFVGAAASAPLVSAVMIGHVDLLFVAFSVLLSAGWFVNAISGPAYFVMLGTGQMRGVVASHITTGAINFVAGWGLGIIAGGVGIALGWAIALIFGALHLLLWVQAERGVRIAPPREAIPLAACGVVAVGLGATAVVWGKSWVVVVVPLVALVLMIPPLLRSPSRHRVVSVLRAALGRPSAG